eukprot:m.77016 g.77016  ORF g.77016 m.77016 type:complete len:206 (+) comp12596_c0_seq3:16-633(+)
MASRQLLVFTFLLFFLEFTASIEYVSQAQLSQVGINVSDITISGISSGASFAVQLSVAYSSYIRGAAVFAGKPWGCEKSFTSWKPGQSESNCNNHPDQINTQTILNDVAKAQQSGLIDNIQNMSTGRYFVFRGNKDPIYQMVNGISALNLTRNFYQQWAKNAATQVFDDVDKLNVCLVTFSVLYKIFQSVVGGSLCSNNIIWLAM